MTRVQAVFELLLAAGFWGFGLVATVWCLTDMSALEVTFYRFAIIIVFVLIICLKSSWRNAFRYEIWQAWIPALFLSALLIFQTEGLRFTTATKSGFITVLYVLIVPSLDWLMFGTRLSLALIGFVWLALLGTALITGFGAGEFNLGDGLTLLCAFCAAGHILTIFRLSKSIKNPFVFNMAQSAWAALFTGLAWAVLNHEPVSWPMNWSVRAWAGLVSLAFGSTLLAFYLQIRAQAKLSPTMSGLLFLLESPFAMVFAFLLLGETLGPREQLGAAIILLASAGAIWSEKNSKLVN